MRNSSRLGYRRPGKKHVSRKRAKRSSVDGESLLQVEGTTPPHPPTTPQKPKPTQHPKPQKKKTPNQPPPKKKTNNPQLPLEGYQGETKTHTTPKKRALRRTPGVNGREILAETQKIYGQDHHIEIQKGRSRKKSATRQRGYEWEPPQKRRKV